MDDMESKQQVQIGSVVKSLDFASKTDCYYVGVVVGINKVDGTFTARTVKRVWEGDNSIGSEQFTAPLPGQYMFEDEWREERIQVLA